MPVELEFKYVLHSQDEIWERLSSVKVPGLIKGCAQIEQAYLSRGGRIRKRSWESRNGVVYPDPEVELIFTYKHDLTNQPGCLEIETDMSKEDYDLAWSEADHKLTKTRLLLPCNNTAGVWEIDFFYDAQGIYLAMAEFEVPAKSGPPKDLHPLVQEYLRYVVPADDNRFKNRKLGDRKYVEKILLEIV